MTDDTELLDVIRDEWVALGLSTQPADRSKAELGSWEAYPTVDERVPKLKIWVQSPMAGVLAAAAINFSIGPSLTTRLWAPLERTLGANVPAARQVRRAVDARVHPVRNAVRNRVAAELSDRTAGWERWKTQMGNYVWDQVWQEIGDPIYSQGWEQDARRSDSLFEENIVAWADELLDGQFSAGAMAQLDALEILGHVDALPFKGIRRTAASCCWWWPYDVGALFCERPVVLETRGKHGYVEFRDGWKVEY